MKTRPILMNGEMVRAVLAGRKTQTRRIVENQPQPDGGQWRHPVRPFQMPDGRWRWVLVATGVGVGEPFECPMGVAGDGLYVRENWCVGNIYDHLAPRDICSHLPREIGKPPCKVAYPASGGCVGLKVRPSILMPKWASRIALEITDVRIERLNDISDADAIAEGIERTSNGLYFRDYTHETMNVVLPIYSFMTLWQSIYCPESWGDNPWVWAVEFKRIEADE